MDLSTQYLGFELPHPFMPGASPLTNDLDQVKRLEDAGAAMIVMPSLFEEQISAEQLATHHWFEGPAESFAEAQTYLPSPSDFALGPEAYLERLQEIKNIVSVPVIASLNGATPGGWLEYAKLLEEAGADALELNTYQLATDPEDSSQVLEERILDIIRTVVSQTEIPTCIKLSPYYTSLSHFAQRLDEAGVAGMALFNRFYQPDIDVEELEATPVLRLSDSSELLLRIRWLAILSGRVQASLAITGGVHTAVDAIKAVMAGANGVQVVSALLQKGPGHLRTLREEMIQWMEEHDYESLEQMRGSMNLLGCPDPKAFERANYLRVLQSWKGFL